MPPATLKALNASIAHWRRLATGKRRSGEGHCADDCALCHEFFFNSKDEFSRCKGCPVKARTGRRLCADTPWGAANAAASDYDSYNSLQFKAAARKELQFLESLLPRKKKGAKNP